MIQLKIYLNFDGNTAKAFQFYQSVFGGTLEINKMNQMPDFQKWIAADESERVMHASLSISDEIVLMASDILPSAGHQLNVGNNFYISLHPSDRTEADRLFKELAEGGVIEMALQDTFWGAYYGSLKDQFGIGWMINLENK